MPPRRRPPRRPASGFSLIELMLVVAIVSILSATASVAWQRYVKRSRTAEASGHLQKMWVGAISYFETDHAGPTGSMLDHQFPFNATTTYEQPCCNWPDQHCPGSSDVFMTEPWKSLNFSIADKHLYRPMYIGGIPDPKKNLWMEVHGDLDCDTTESVFVRKANVLANGDVQGYATPAIVNETE
jgi:prepilin-type N-terminal cleavage/methylation domain-containing protein